MLTNVRWMILVLNLMLSMLLMGCGGTKEFGEACEAGSDCQAGLCVAGADGDQTVCTRSCASTDQCPEGWTCSGATEENVLICVHRPSTPFGH